MEHYTYEIQLYCQKKESETYKEIYIPSNGEMIQTEIVCSGDIFIIPNNTLRLNDIIGNEKDFAMQCME